MPSINCNCFPSNKAMSFESPLLHRINKVTEAPPETYLIYNLAGGIFWMFDRDYSNFCLQWINASNPPPLTMDLSSVRIHSVILDFDYKGNSKSFGAIFELIESILKTTLLPNVQNFTYIISIRKNHRGIHVHLPEFKIGYDDYIILCESLQHQFNQVGMWKEQYELDILTNAMLPGAAKPTCTPYVPVRIVYVDERNKFILDIRESLNDDLKKMKKVFVKRKDNEKSIFRNILNFTPKLIVVKLKLYTMPIVENVSIHSLLYATNIGKLCNSSSDWEDVATFKYKCSDEIGFIKKSKTLVFNSSLLKTYYYLKLNTKTIMDFVSDNRALTRWYARFNQENLGKTSNANVPEMFRALSDQLQFEHSSLSKDDSPIKTIMQFNEGYYFIPVFYSLCRHYESDSSTMAKNLRPLLDDSFHKLLEKIEKFQSQVVQYEIEGITLNTLHFCANNLYRERPKKNMEKLKSIVENNKNEILSVTTENQMLELIRKIQDRHLPVRVFKLKSGLKKASRYIWNALEETWQEIALSNEISDHLNNLYNYVKQFVKDYRASGGIGGPDEDLLNKFSIHSVVCAINSDTSMERKDIQMDAHKWLLRLPDGILDLLTGHVGGVVPEFFLSDRKINLGFSRSEMMFFCNDSAKHVALYESLTDKRFFYRYLQNLFLNVREDLMDTLCESIDGENDDLFNSMLHFYVNICKCVSFEYDTMMYMLDVLASIFIATNYERKFFVWKGLTRNGKSKLFELLSRVLGSYYHSIQSDNLAPCHSTNNATPELASTLFSCRMVAVEELGKKIDENRVKQITGNSFVTFRNMYEQNSGGIPTAKIFATTNNYPECIASEAFKDRVVAIPFDAEFTDSAPESTSEQVESNTFMKDVYVMEQSYKGCFFVLYYHLKKCMSLEDGLLHYRTQPEHVMEFTNEYLLHADVYVQFKLHMDVQSMPGTMTTMNDLKSAARQYLKTTKNTSQPESNLVIAFEKEFGHLRRQDISLKTDAFSYTSVLDEEELDEEPPKKAAKRDDSVLIYFEGVVIKNMKRANLDG